MKIFDYILILKGPGELIVTLEQPKWSNYLSSAWTIVKSTCIVHLDLEAQLYVGCEDSSHRFCLDQGFSLGFPLVYSFHF